MTQYSEEIQSSALMTNCDQQVIDGFPLKRASKSESVALPWSRGNAIPNTNGSAMRRGPKCLKWDKEICHFGFTDYLMQSKHLHAKTTSIIFWPMHENVHCQFERGFIWCWLTHKLNKTADILQMIFSNAFCKKDIPVSWSKKDVNTVRKRWSYVVLALTHQCVFGHWFHRVLFLMVQTMTNQCWSFSWLGAEQHMCNTWYDNTWQHIVGINDDMVHWRIYA